MPNPLVSVLIDTYNHERFIEEAVHSVLSQDFPAADREIIVVDDGSTDKTLELLRQFEPHVRILHKENGGQASAFNHGIAQCRGEIVAFLDGDDWWAPSKLSRVIKAMMADASIGIIGHGIVNVNRDGTQMIETLREGFRFQANTVDGASLIVRRGSFLGTSRMTIRSEVLKRIGSVPPGIRLEADEYLFTLAAVLATVQILPDPLTYYRLHDANLFLISDQQPQRLRNKQKALAILAQGLSQKLAEWEIDPALRRALVAYPSASADQIRLQLDGGPSWETVSTEWTLYTAVHPDVGATHRAFKMLTLLAALLTPPRFFYKVRLSLAQSNLYKRIRERLFPIPEMPHIEKRHPGTMR